MMAEIPNLRKLIPYPVLYQIGYRDYALCCFNNLAGGVATGCSTLQRKALLRTCSATEPEAGLSAQALLVNVKLLNVK